MKEAAADILWVFEQAVELYIEGSPIYDHLKGEQWTRKKKILMEDFLIQLIEVYGEAKRIGRPIRTMLERLSLEAKEKGERVNLNEWRARQAALRGKKSLSI